MKEILDEIEFKNNQTRFSKLALITSLITLGLFCFIILSIPKTIKASEGLPHPPMLIVYATQFFCLAGIVLTILSILKKESSTWMKWVGGILNVLLFVLMVGSVIFANGI